MEKKIEKKIDNYLSNFKEEIRNKILELEVNRFPENCDKLLQFIYDKENLKLTKEDFMKRKRNKNVVNDFERCIAKRANGDNCSRRKKEGSQYCGTHIKGIVNCDEKEELCDSTDSLQKIEVIAKEIEGIIHYIDNKGNIYQMEDVIQNKPNPTCIGKYNKVNGEYNIILNS